MQKVTPLGKTEQFFAYTVSQKGSKLLRKTYGTLLNIPEQNCMQNLEHFQHISLLMKIPNALFPPSPSDKPS